MATDRAQRPVHAVIDRLRIRVSEDARYLFRRHFIDHVELNREPLVGRECFERAREHHTLFRRHGGIRGRVGCRGRGLCELSGEIAARAPADRPVCATQLAEERSEGEIGRVAGPQHLVGFDMRASVDEYVFENALLKGWQRGGDC